jgi:hypothetical protein
MPLRLRLHRIARHGTSRRPCHVNLPVVILPTATAQFCSPQAMEKIKTRLKDVIYFDDSYDTGTGIPMESVLPHRPWQILFTSQMYGLIDKEK